MKGQNILHCGLVIFIITSIIALAITKMQLESKWQKQKAVNGQLDRIKNSINEKNIIPQPDFQRNLNFLESECDFKDADTIYQSTDAIAQCISFRNQIITNQTKALLWGLK